MSIIIKAENANIALAIVRLANAEICYFFIQIGLILMYDGY